MEHLGGETLQKEVYHRVYTLRIYNLTSLTDSYSFLTVSEHMILGSLLRLPAIMPAVSFVDLPMKP